MSENQPGIVRDNPLTRMMDSVKQMNQDRGALAGRVTGTPVIPLSSSRVRSSEMQTFIPLTSEEIDDRNRLAVEAGILNAEEIEEGIAESVNWPREGVQQLVSKPTPEAIARPRLINFKNVQGMDFHRNVAYVDGFEIKIPLKDVKLFKKYVIDLAVDFVTEQLAQAIAEIAPEEEAMKEPGDSQISEENPDGSIQETS